MTNRVGVIFNVLQLWEWDQKQKLIATMKSQEYKVK